MHHSQLWDGAGLREVLWGPVWCQPHGRIAAEESGSSMACGRRDLVALRVMAFGPQNETSARS